MDIICVKFLDFSTPINLPNSVQDIIHQYNNNTAHPGILAALTSLRNGKSPKTAYILVLGSSGSGKSSLVRILSVFACKK
jgi:energy-coupling factor transporter ATP-binding protein EcfA2